MLKACWNRIEPWEHVRAGQQPIGPGVHLSTEPVTLGPTPREAQREPGPLAGEEPAEAMAAHVVRRGSKAVKDERTMQLEMVVVP